MPADRHVLRAALRILDREGGAGLEALAARGPSAGNVDELLGLERVLAALPEASIVDADKSDVSFENRRRFALRTMQRLLETYNARKE